MNNTNNKINNKINKVNNKINNKINKIGKVNNKLKRQEGNEIDDNDNEDINLGGFPPIIYQSQTAKKKREFTKKISNAISKSTIDKMNILSIKNILNI